MFHRSTLLATALAITALVPLGTSAFAHPGGAAPGFHPAGMSVIPHPGAAAPGLHPAQIALPASKVGPFVKPNPGPSHPPLVVARPGGDLNHSVLHPAPNVQLPPPVTPQPHTTEMKGHWWRPGGIITAIDPVAVGAPSVVAGIPSVAVHAPGTVATGTLPLTRVPSPAAAEPCTCLTKQYLDDGSVLFRDICTKEAAIATAVDLKALGQGPAPGAQ